MRPTTDLSDDHEDSSSTCATQFRDFGGRARFAGRIRTVRCFEDNARLKEMLGEPGNGGVLIVDGAASTARALLGDMLAARAAANGWSGVIINGAIRDSSEVAKVEVGVKALGVNPARSSKTGAGEVDVPIEFGGVRFQPGHWVYCDEDGVLVSAKQLK
ncbi:MAG: RraA family protein [Gammaproteobacteria bacterium]|nr:RraA family protein [Gammaproteobacteria bacterium]MYF68106.1 RraA family protein [Gammaproteobacteria bacterium]MYK37611.1 RraA family protein [Gammaproteobacteria bacterium]